MIWEAWANRERMAQIMIEIVNVLAVQVAVTDPLELSQKAFTLFKKACSTRSSVEQPLAGHMAGVHVCACACVKSPP